MIIEAPFLDKQVQCINTYQNSDFNHPFTCKCRRILKADNKGMYCTKCSYKQGWVHDFMAEYRAKYCNNCSSEIHPSFNTCFRCKHAFEV